MKESSSHQEQGEEINSSHATFNTPLERHYSNNVGILVAKGPSSYNIEEIFGSFTFDLHRKEVKRKKFWMVKERDGQVREINEDEVLFYKIDEDPMLISTASISFTQANINNISILNEKLVEAELKNKKLEE